MTRLRGSRLRFDARRWRRRRVGPVLCMAADWEERALHEIEGLQEALTHRDVIGQAKGILMERFKIDAAAAFDLLREASQHQNRKLRDLAESLARTGEWPPI